MGLFTALFASRRSARILVVDPWRIGDRRAASFSYTRSIRNDYLDPLYARLAYEARKLWLELQSKASEPFIIDCGWFYIMKKGITHEINGKYYAVNYNILKRLKLSKEEISREI